VLDTTGDDPIPITVYIAEFVASLHSPFDPVESGGDPADLGKLISFARS
jgi:hypothetical protein